MSPTMDNWMSDLGADTLAVLCEQRIGRRALAAARIRVSTPAGARTHALALSDCVLWWIALDRWRTRLGPVLAWRPLDGLVIHTTARRRGGHRLELSSPATGELLTGIVHGPGAERLVGQLTADQFARVAATCPAPPEQP